jgi:hypothetical protein
MGFNVGSFRGNGLPYGGARPTLFKVVMTFPTIIPGQLTEQMSLNCRAASLPPSVIQPINIPYFGRTIKVAGDRTFAPWTVRVQCDEDFDLRNAFMQWHNGINTLISNRLDERIASISPTLAGSYKTVASVTQFSKTGPGDIDGPGAINTFLFNGIFPTEIGAIQVDWEDTNRIEEFDVTFEYDWYEPSIKANDQPLFPLELNPA